MALLRASTEAGEEERKFLQHRVARFGLAAGACYFTYLLFRMVSAAFVQQLSLLKSDPSFWYHALSAGVFTGIWAFCRRGTLSISLIRSVETLGLFAGTASTVVMASYIELYGRPDHILLLALSSAFMARTLYVPSSARRTMLLALMTGLELVVGVYVTFLGVDPPRWRALSPAIAAMTPEDIARTLAISAAVWWLLTSGLATAASQVIYGLRRQVRDAMQLGQYQLEEKIGEGGMGSVYRARHALLRRPTAIKMLLPDRNGAGDLARFEREVQQTARLSHPNIITIFDYGHTPEHVFYYAMEYLDGLTLSQLVERHGPQPVARVQGLLAQIAAALVHAHGEALIHRDIKPANIMVFLPHRHGGQAEQVKLLDFGLVKEIAPRGGIDLTHSDAISGTPQYMSPESIRAPESVDGRSDLYAVGAVAYYLLSGHNVFDGNTLIEVCGHHLNTPAPPLSSRCQNPIPQALETCVMSCLAKDPAARPQSALELLQRLDQVARSAEWNAETTRAWWQANGRDGSSKPSGALHPTVLTIDVRAPTQRLEPQPEAASGPAGADQQ